MRKESNCLSLVRLSTEDQLESYCIKDRETSVLDFNDARNHVIDTLRAHGSVGPIGRMDLQLAESYLAIDGMIDIDAWEYGDMPCDFFVVDDKMSYVQGCTVVEIAESAMLSAELFRALSAVSRSLDWAVLCHGRGSSFVLSGDTLFHCRDAMTFEEFLASF